MISKNLHRIITFLLICFFIIGTCVSSFAVTSAASVTGDAKEGKKVTVKVAFYQLDGFFEYDKNGKECGYGVDYLNELSKYENIEWKYVPVDSWEDIKGLMENGTVDVRMPVSEPTNPSGEYDYTAESIMMTYHALMTLKNKKSLYYQGYDAISNMKIGVTSSLLAKTGVTNYLKSINADKKLVYFDDYNSCRAALDNGKVDAIISNIMDLTDDMKVLDKFCVVDNYITTMKDNPKFKIINSAMTELKLANPGFQNFLYEKYFLNRAIEPFTKNESKYIASKDYLTVAVYDKRRPVSYFDEKSDTYKGIAIDAAELISKQIGIPFKYISIDTDTQYEMLEKADLVMPVRNIEDEEERYFMTKSFLNPEIILAVRIGDDFIDKKSKIGVLSATPGILRTMKSLGEFDLVEYKSNDEALAALQKGEIDGFANSSYVINWKLENPRYSDLTSLHYQSIPLDFSFAGKSEDSVLQSILNKGISSISDDELDKIVQSDSVFTFDDLTLMDKLDIYKKPFILGFIALVILIAIALLYNHSRTKYILKIEESGRKQEKASLAKTEFLSRMSHDMRTPLNVIIGMGHFAEENDNPPDTRECLSKINIASEFLLGLVNDVLDMEHIDSGKMTLQLTPYSGEEFKQYIDSVITPLCEEKNIHFEYSYSGPMDFVILQDKLRINQVYFNLLSNSVKYTEEGGLITFHTNVSRIENRIKLHVEIADTGIGMSEEFQKSMFEPFSQENQKIKPIGEGTGLGLSIVKKICDMMDMTISVKSKLGEGTTFILEGIYDIADEKLTTENVEKRKKEALLNDDILKDKTILVCEDHPMNQAIIKRLLEKKGIIVVLEDDGKRGVETYEHSVPGNFAAILMDIRMPVMDGLTATKTIRQLARPDAKTIPIIALTANAYEEDIKNCLDAGMNAHLGKPIEPELLYKTLKKFMIDN